MENTRENDGVEEKREKGLYMKICCVRFVKNEQISERAG